MVAAGAALVFVGAAAACGDTAPESGSTTSVPKAELVAETWTAMAPALEPRSPWAELKPVAVQPLGDGTALVIGGARGDGQGGWEPWDLVARLDLSTGALTQLPNDIGGSGAMWSMGAGLTDAGVLALISRCELVGEQGGCDRGSRSVHLVRLDGDRWIDVDLPAGAAEHIAADPSSWGPHLFVLDGTPVIGFASGTADATEWSFFVGNGSTEPIWRTVDAPVGVSSVAMNFGPQLCATRDALAALVVVDTRSPETASVRIPELVPTSSVAVATLDPARGTWSTSEPIPTENGLGHGYLACSADRVHVKVNTVPAAYFAVTPGSTDVARLTDPPGFDESSGARLFADAGSPSLFIGSNDAGRIAVLRPGSDAWVDLPPPSTEEIDDVGRSLGAYSVGFVADGSTLIDVARFQRDGWAGRAYGLRLPG